MQARLGSAAPRILLVSMLILTIISCGAPSNAPQEIASQPTESFAAEQTTHSMPIVLTDFGKPFDGLRKASGSRHVLTILFYPLVDPNNPAAEEIVVPTNREVENMIFGPGPSVRDYFFENSGGLFTIESAGVLGWYGSDHPRDLYWREGAYAPDKWVGTSRYLANAKAYIDDDGFSTGHIHKYAEAIIKADQEFDFRSYDVNDDGVLSGDELVISIVQLGSPPNGYVRDVYKKEYPKQQALIVDKVRIDVIMEAYIDVRPSLASIGILAHELSHLLLSADDMYFDDTIPGYPYRAGSYSLMDEAGLAPHLDPFLKLKLGWVTPVAPTENGWYLIPDVETQHRVFILYDPTRGETEYFIVENRWLGGSYDSNLPDTGLAIWHIIEDPQVYEDLSAPPGVDPQIWAQETAWGRRAIRLMRPIYAFSNEQALWNGCETPDGEPNRAVLRWADGTASGFSIDPISGPGADMEAFISVPGDPNYTLSEQGLHLRNDTNDTIWATVGFFDPCAGNLASKGWWRIDPGQTVHPISRPLHDRNYFIWAYDDKGRTWDGQERWFWVHPQERFGPIPITLDKATAESLGYEQRVFREIQTDGASSHTLNLVVSMPSCDIDVNSAFSAFWSQEPIYSELGCPISNAQESMAAEERFQYGAMLWRDGSDQIYVLYDDGTWLSYEDTFVEGTDPEYGCGIASSPPSPRRGFSKVWCFQPGVRERLGEAVEEEVGYGMIDGGPAEVFQDFAGGLMFQSHQFNKTCALFNRGTWLCLP